MPKDIYWLTSDELATYERELIEDKHNKEIVDLGFSKFLVFDVAHKPGVVIAWPTVDGYLTGRPKHKVHFEQNSEMQDKISRATVRHIDIALFPLWFTLPQPQN